jgi:hypothetical protein
MHDNMVFIVETQSRYLFGFLHQKRLGTQPIGDGVCLWVTESWRLNGRYDYISFSININAIGVVC